MGQNPISLNTQVAGSGALVPQIGDSATALTAQRGIPVAGISGTSSVINMSAATVVKASPGRCIRISVTTAGAAGSLADVATTGAVAAANIFFTVPATVGVYTLEWPCLVGIVYTPGAAQVASVSFS